MKKANLQKFRLYPRVVVIKTIKISLQWNDIEIQTARTHTHTKKNHSQRGDHLKTKIIFKNQSYRERKRYRDNSFVHWSTPQIATVTTVGGSKAGKKKKEHLPVLLGAQDLVLSTIAFPGH